jgi:hypothetical protein
MNNDLSLNFRYTLRRNNSPIFTFIPFRFAEFRRFAPQAPATSFLIICASIDATSR